MKIKRPGHPEFVWELRYDGQASRSIFPVMSEAVRTIDLVESLDEQAWGAIPDCLAAYPGTTAIPAGEIVIPLGSLAEGYTHVREKHGHKIAHFHPGLSLESYLQNVLRHFQRIYRNCPGTPLACPGRLRESGLWSSWREFDGIFRYKLAHRPDSRSLPGQLRFIFRRTVHSGFSGQTEPQNAPWWLQPSSMVF